MQGLPDYFDQLITKLQTTEERGILPPKFVFPRVISDAQNIITGLPFADSGDSSALFQDIHQKVAKLDADEAAKQDLLQRAESALKDSVQPAYQQLISFLEEQEQRATADDGAWKFPDGEAYYTPTPCAAPPPPTSPPTKFTRLASARWNASTTRCAAS